MSLENTLTAPTPPTAKAVSTKPARPQPRWLGALTAALIVIAVALGMIQTQPPAVVPATAPATQFSAERAMKDLRAIAQRPHPVGSAESAVVRSYLVERIRSMGLDPQVREGIGVQENRLESARKATVAFTTNIATRIKGTGTDDKAVLVMGHYDTIMISPGASDDGSSIASMLETMRNLLASPRLHNDVIFLMTDSEEYGQEGATAFLANDPWAKDVAVVLNFEGRGSSGPSVMFETSAQNGWLVREFAKSAASPVASSLAPQIYQWMPNDTDLTSFKRAGYAGLNFAYGYNYEHYHTVLDSIASIDVRSLQHHGAYMSSLTRHFGSIPLVQQPQANVVYFTAFGKVILYTTTTAWALGLTALAVFATVGYVGAKRRGLTVGGVLQGAAGLFLSTILAAGTATAIWMGLQAIRHGLLATDENGVHNAYLYIIGFTAMTVAITLGILGYCRRRVGEINLTMGVLLVHLLLTIVSCVAAPGASYLFFVPTAAGLSATVIRTLAGESLWTRLVSLALHTTALLLVVPSLALGSIWTPMFLVAIPMTLISLTTGFLEEPLRLLQVGKPWVFPVLSGAAGLIFVIGLGLFTGFDAKHPMPTTLVYVHNGDQGSAAWATLDYAVHEWNHSVLDEPELGTKDELLPWLPFHETPILKQQTKAAPATVTMPGLQILADDRAGDQRSIRLRVKAAPGSFLVGRITSDHMLGGVQLEGRAFDPAVVRKGFRVVNMPAEGVVVGFQLTGSAPVHLSLGSMVAGVPDNAGKPPVDRPDWTMPGWEWDLSTFATKSFQVGD